MARILKRLSLGLLFIGGTSAILLLSDVERRTSDTSRVEVAILQFATSPLMDAGVKGMREALADSDFSKTATIALRFYNAEGDMPTANAIASEITSGRYDLILTSGTPAMQAVANANRQGKTTHVFGLVADPFGAGVGISRENPLDHPPHMVGIGSFVPVVPAFELARQMFPSLKTVGNVWNPAESNSEAFTREARKVSADLGIELLEANVDNTAGVFEAASSLVARGVEALWIGGDNTVASAADSVVAAARAGRIPVFSIPLATRSRELFLNRGPTFTRSAGRRVNWRPASWLELTRPPLPWSIRFPRDWSSIARRWAACVTPGDQPGKPLSAPTGSSMKAASGTSPILQPARRPAKPLWPRRGS